MEFWGVEVKAGETLKVQPGDDKLLHLSQAALGETEKGKGTDFSLVFLKFGDQKLVLGSLSVNCPQLNFDLVFEKEFELSHNWKKGSVYFMGYKSLPDNGDEISDGSGDFSDEDMPLALVENEEPEPQAAKATETVVKSKMKAVEPIKDEDDSDESESETDSDSDPDSDDLAKATETVVKSKVKVVEPVKDEDDSDDSESDDLDSDEDLDGAEDDSEEDEDDSEDSEEDEETPTPKKAVGNKKRPAESATKTPVPAKEAKATTPQKTDGKKGGHTATPHPAKKGDKSKTPKFGGEITCKSCSKPFKSEQAMEAHSKAKHGAGK